MEAIKKLIGAADELPKLLKIILALPFLDIVWVVYRLLKSVVKQNILGVVLAAILIIVGIPFLWLVDLIFILLDKNVLWLD